MPDLSREEELGLWRIVPAFLRKRSKTPVAQEEPGPEEPSEVPPAPPAGKEEGRSKLELRQRLSWTYGGSRANRRVETEPAERQEVMRSTSVVERRELQRGSSFPGRLGAAGGISKEEARRRLVSWRRTTIVRKTSEQTA